MRTSCKLQLNPVLNQIGARFGKKNGRIWPEPELGAFPVYAKILSFNGWSTTLWKNKKKTNENWSNVAHHIGLGQNVRWYKMKQTTTWSHQPFS